MARNGRKNRPGGPPGGWAPQNSRYMVVTMKDVGNAVGAAVEAIAPIMERRILDHILPVMWREMQWAAGRIWLGIGGGLLPPGSPWQPSPHPGQWLYTGQMPSGIAGPPAPPSLLFPTLGQIMQGHAGGTMQEALAAAAQQAQAAVQAAAQQATSQSIREVAQAAVEAAAAQPAAAPNASPASAQTGSKKKGATGEAHQAPAGAKGPGTSQKGAGSSSKGKEAGKGKNGAKPAAPMTNNPLFEPEGATGRKPVNPGAKPCPPHLAQLNAKRKAEAAARKEASGGKERWHPDRRNKSKGTKGQSQPGLATVPEGKEPGDSPPSPRSPLPGWGAARGRRRR